MIHSGASGWRVISESRELFYTGAKLSGTKYDPGTTVFQTYPFLLTIIKIIVFSYSVLVYIDIPQLCWLIK